MTRLQKIILEFKKDDGSIVFYEFYNFKPNPYNKEYMMIHEITDTFYEMGKDWVTDLPLHHQPIRLALDIDIKEVRDYKVGIKENAKDNN